MTEYDHNTKTLTISFDIRLDQKAADKLNNLVDEYGFTERLFEELSDDAAYYFSHNLRTDFDTILCERIDDILSQINELRADDYAQSVESEFEYGTYTEV